MSLGSRDSDVETIDAEQEFDIAGEFFAA